MDEEIVKNKKTKIKNKKMKIETREESTRPCRDTQIPKKSKQRK